MQLFEGLKVYRGIDGKIRMFRPDLNMKRMNNSALGSGLPTFDGMELIKCVSRLVQVDQEWVPHSEGSSLYIRPTLIGIDVSISKMYFLYMIVMHSNMNSTNSQTEIIYISIEDLIANYIIEVTYNQEN